MEIDKKPSSMSMKDFLVRTQAVKMMKSEKLIDAVVSHQFQSALQAVKQNNSVEISGFGKFYFNVRKAEKKLERLVEKEKVILNHLANTELTETRRQRYEVMLRNNTAEMEFLKTKLNEASTDLRGMEEQVDSCLRYEGED